MTEISGVPAYNPNNDYRAYAEQLWVYNCAFVTALHNTTTAGQRTHAAKKLKGWESDIRVLVPSMETAELGSSSP